MKQGISSIKLDISHIKDGKVNSLCGKVNLKHHVPNIKRRISPAIRLKRYFELFTSRVNRNFFNLGLPDASEETLLYIPDTLIDVFIASLCKHLNRAVKTIADKAGYTVTIGYAVCREPKPHPLHLADENYMFGDLTHCAPYITQSDWFLSKIDIACSLINNYANKNQLRTAIPTSSGFHNFAF